MLVWCSRFYDNYNDFTHAPGNHIHIKRRNTDIEKQIYIAAKNGNYIATENGNYITRNTTGII